MNKKLFNFLLWVGLTILGGCVNGVIFFALNKILDRGYVLGGFYLTTGVCVGCACFFFWEKWMR